jgi:hypothetical protein
MKSIHRFFDKNKLILKEKSRKKAIKRNLEIRKKIKSELKKHVRSKCNSRKAKK